MITVNREKNMESKLDSGRKVPIKKKRKRRSIYDSHFTRVQVSRELWLKAKEQASVFKMPIFKLIQTYIMEGLARDEDVAIKKQRRKEYWEEMRPYMKPKGVENK